MQVCASFESNESLRLPQRRYSDWVPTKSRPLLVFPEPPTPQETQPVKPVLRGPEAFYKTRYCRYFTQGSCWKGEQCMFAHSEEELRSSPDLARTRMCPLFRTGRCRQSAEECIFAHSLSDLKATDAFYRTEICSFWSAGFCRAGTACRHAHGEEALRPKLTQRGEHAHGYREAQKAHPSLRSGEASPEREVHRRAATPTSSTTADGSEVSVSRHSRESLNIPIGVTGIATSSSGTTSTESPRSNRRHVTNSPTTSFEGTLFMNSSLMDRFKTLSSCPVSDETGLLHPQVAIPLMKVCRGIPCQVPVGILRSAGCSDGVPTHDRGIVVGEPLQPYL